VLSCPVYGAITETVIWYEINDLRNFGSQLLKTLYDNKFSTILEKFGLVDNSRTKRLEEIVVKIIYDNKILS